MSIDFKQCASLLDRHIWWYSIPETTFDLFICINKPRLLLERDISRDQKVQWYLNYMYSYPGIKFDSWILVTKSCCLLNIQCSRVSFVYSLSFKMFRSRHQEREIVSTWLLCAVLTAVERSYVTFHPCIFFSRERHECHLYMPKILTEFRSPNVEEMRERVYLQGVG